MSTIGLLQSSGSLVASGVPSLSPAWFYHTHHARRKVKTLSRPSRISTYSSGRLTACHPALCRSHLEL